MLLHASQKDYLDLMNTIKELFGVVKQAIAVALEEHRRMGRSIVVWRDGKVVTILPSEIPQRKESEDRAA